MKKKKIDSSPYGSKLNVNEWSKSRKKISDLYPSEKKFFLQKIKLSNSFIDIGCATGNFINIISKYTKIKNYLGIDISKNMVDKAKLNFPHYDFKYYDGKKIIYNKKSDLVYSFGTLQYCNNYKEIISQMISASKKFVIFDLRFCLDKDLINIKKSYQIIPHSKKKRLPYNILNFPKFLDYIINTTKKKYKIEFFGYKNKPAPNCVTIHKKVYMLSILIDKTKNFELSININEKKN